MVVDEKDDFSKPGMVFVFARMVHETDKAILIEPFIHNDSRYNSNVWLPKEGLNRIERFQSKERQQYVCFYIHRYTAEKKRIRYYESREDAIQSEGQARSSLAGSDSIVSQGQAEN